MKAYGFTDTLSTTHTCTHTSRAKAVIVGGGEYVLILIHHMLQAYHRFAGRTGWYQAIAYACTYLQNP